jgi:ATP-dependent helicase/nuclease subunit B
MIGERGALRFSNCPETRSSKLARMAHALSKPELLARLAEGHAARITVVTPNRRLAQSLTAEFDACQSGNGLTAWEAPDILPLGAFVARLWEDALYCDLELPLLLTEAQEQAIWEEIVGNSNLLSVSDTAAQCRDAWRIAHAWRIPIQAGAGGEDAQAFGEWAKSYEARTRGETDAARLSDVVLGQVKNLTLPRLLVAYAFDIAPPQTREFLSAFDLGECHPESVEASALKTSAPSAQQEMECAAAWARLRLEQGKRRIGVVVPDLARRRKEVVRVFSRVMQPASGLPGAAQSAMPFNVSLGAPLADLPLIDLALSVIELSFRELEFARLSRFIRSPFLGGAETEMARRARLDVDLRGTLGAMVSLPTLVASAGRCALLRQHLEAVFSLKKGAKESPASWARHFSALLEAAGFPGERTLDGEEFQAHAKWHETLGELAKLERISRLLAIQEAFACLQRLCRDTLFQPAQSSHGTAVPIQVLGVLESAGLSFDCLWVSGLTDEAWPLEARPNPFLPLALQKKAGVPQASPETSAALDRRLTQAWLGCAAEVIVSWPEKEEDRDLAPSPLIAHIPEGRLELPEFPRFRDLIFKSKRFVKIEDASGPSVPPGPVRGGTRVLADQAACPFRAFARHRLAAEPLEAPPYGPDASDRGKLLHALMREIWTELKDSAALQHQNLVPVIQRAAEAAVKEAGIEGRFAELERVRLAKLADEWLALEKNRKGFEVIALEEKRALRIANLEFSSRIDRMDRLLEGEGGHVLIDYKTGNRVTPKDWEPPRPDDPQLPLYAVAAEEALSAVAFAKLRPGAMRFAGFSKSKEILPQVRPAKNWPALLAGWKEEAEALGGAFAVGAAAVDPKRDLKTCERCDLQTLCRVYEKFNVLEEPDDEEGNE